MNLYIVRHGPAEPRDQYARGSDAQRPLTAAGKHKTSRAAQGLSAAGCRPDRIISSPLVRAKQTAEIIASALGGDISVEFSELLAPGAPTKKVLSWLAGLWQMSAL